MVTETWNGKRWFLPLPQAISLHQHGRSWWQQTFGTEAQNRFWAGFVECETDDFGFLNKWHRRNRLFPSKDSGQLFQAHEWLANTMPGSKWCRENPIDSPLRPFFLSMLACGFPCASKEVVIYIRDYRKRMKETYIGLQIACQFTATRRCFYMIFYDFLRISCTVVDTIRSDDGFFKDQDLLSLSGDTWFNHFWI